MAGKDLLCLTVQLSSVGESENEEPGFAQFVIALVGDKHERIERSWWQILGLDERLRMLHPDATKELSKPSSFICGESQKADSVVNPIIKGFRKLFKKLPSNSNPAQILDSTNNYPIFHPKHPLIQESLDKIALYFQHILTNPELASSQTFKKFMNVIPSSSSSSSSSSVSEGQVVDNPLLDRKVKRSKRFNEKIVLPERQNPLLSGLNGKIGLESFDIIKVLGRGCMGKVMLVTFKPTSQLFALKSIHKSSVVRNQEVEHTRSERDILVTLSRLKHPFLIQLHFSFQTATELFLVMDYYPGGDLATQLARNHRFSLDRARFYAAEMILGIEELHAHGIVYRDLKPENVLLSNTGHIVLTDFGLSKQLLGHQYLHHHQEEESDYCNNEGYYAKTFCGTAEYLAPEVLLSQNYGFSVDWWSFGTLLYEMITGITPFWAENHLEMYKRVLNDQLEFPLNLVPPLAQDLIRGLLQRDPKMRLGLQEIKEHAFFASINWMDLKALRVTPPFIPDLKSVYDLSNFEDIFTAMTPMISPTQETLSPSVQKSFLGFSFDSRTK